MLRRTNLFLMVIVGVFLSTSCSLHDQLREYTHYKLHDLIVENDQVYILLEKYSVSPEVTVTSAVTGYMNQRVRYRIISCSLISFYKEDLSVLGDKNLQLSREQNIVRKRTMKSIGNPSIIDSNRIYSSSDFVNEYPYRSIMYLDDSRMSRPVTGNKDARHCCRSFDRKKLLYYLDNNLYLYDTQLHQRTIFSNDYTEKTFLEEFDRTYMANNGEWFFKHVTDDRETMSFVYELVDKKQNKVLSRFLSKSNRLQDFNDKVEGGMLLTYNFLKGLEIIDLQGNVLYSVQDDSFKYIMDAVMDGDKVYAAGIKFPETEFGTYYIEILEWDYKNDVLHRKFFPCDSPELEM